MTLTFSDWHRSRLYEATATTEAGHRAGAITLTLRDSTRSTAPASGGVAFRLVSGADIAALTPGTIRHRAPVPGESSAETTKCVHVDFTDDDFCWRYSPVPDADAVRPWLALLVGTPDEIIVDGAQAQVAHSVLTGHKLSTSALRAHRMSDGARSVSRLLSFRPLQPQTSYVVVLVPAVDAGGGPAWPDDIDTDQVLTVLDSWRFQTAEAGDFETLAAALRIPPTGDLGRADLHYRRGGLSLGPVQVGGALASLKDPEPADLAVLGQIGVDLDRVRGHLPDYGPPWAEPAGHPAAVPGWLEDLDTDIRARSQAGIGGWMGVEGQESLMRAATEQAGALLEAAGLVRHLAFGLDAAGRIWNRQLPTDPAARLGVLGPLLHQLISETGGRAEPAVNWVCGPDTFVEPALFSGAAQRVRGLRSGELLTDANEPDDPEEPPAPDSITGLCADLGVDLGVFGFDRDRTERLDRLLAELTAMARLLASKGPDPEVAAALVEELVRLLADAFTDGLGGGCEPLAVLGATARGLGLVGPQELATLLLDRPDPEAVVYTVLQDELLRCLIGWHPAERPALRRPPPERRRPIDLVRLVGAIVGAVDPRQPRPPAVEQIQHRVGGLDIADLAPVRYALGLDYPTWSLLREHDREWLLPGADQVPPDSVSALRTDPGFVDAYLVGLNTQFLAEARWRGLPVARTATPLRMFWGASVGGDRQPDVTPLTAWTPTESLGDLAHQATQPTDPGATGSQRLVLLFHTPLFRRYPRTTVHLLKAPPGVPDAGLSSPPGADLRSPTFVGSLTPDLVFFLFDVPPDALDAYWLILDEPPADLRFRFDLLGDTVTLTQRSSEVAERALDSQTRVALSGAELESMARGGVR